MEGDVRARRGAGFGRRLQAEGALRRRLHGEGQRHGRHERLGRRGACACGRADARRGPNPVGTSQRWRQPPRDHRRQRRRERSGLPALGRGLGHEVCRGARVLPRAHAGHEEHLGRLRPRVPEGVVQRAARLQDGGVRPDALLHGRPHSGDLLHARRHVAHHVLHALHGSDPHRVHHVHPRGGSAGGERDPAGRRGDVPLPRPRPRSTARSCATA